MVLVLAGALDAVIGYVALAIALVSWVGLVAIARQAARSPVEVERALAPGSRDRLRGDVGRRRRRHREACAPDGTTRARTAAGGPTDRGGPQPALCGRCGPASPARRLPTGHGVTNAPVLVQIHGGGWIIGDKREQGRPLMHHLAANGWVCVAPNYRLSPRVSFPEHLIDVKRALAWVREHVAEYGGDPGFVAITGRLRRGPPRRPRRTHRQRSRVPAGVRARRHLGGRLRAVLRAVRPDRALRRAGPRRLQRRRRTPRHEGEGGRRSGGLLAGLAARPDPPRRPAVHDRPRDRRLAGPRRRGPGVRGGPGRGRRPGRRSTWSCPGPSMPSRSSTRFAAKPWSGGSTASSPSCSAPDEGTSSPSTGFPARSRCSGGARCRVVVGDRPPVPGPDPGRHAGGRRWRSRAASGGSSSSRARTR